MKPSLYLASLLLLGACSHKQMYEAGLTNHRIECQKLKLKEQEACLDEHNKPYDQYKQEREAYFEELEGGIQASPE